VAVNTTKVNIPTQLDPNNQRVLLSTLQLVEDFANNPRIEAVTDLNQTISDPPTQAEVQAISDKIDELLGKLRSANSNILDT
jgi:hypothetical protein